jgi:hypothetical protein
MSPADQAITHFSFMVPAVAISMKEAPWVAETNQKDFPESWLAKMNWFILATCSNR